MNHAASPSLPVRAQLLSSLSRGTSDLPTLPRGATEALRLARTTTLDFKELATVAAGDPPLAARIISVANSAAYARAGMQSIASVRHAAIRLGTQTTRDVLYQVAYASMFADAPRHGQLIEATFAHGVTVGRVARLLARDHGLDGDVAFLAGLLHDIGRARCWKVISQLRDPVTEADSLPVVDELHVRAGTELAVAWHLPVEVVEACRFHHDPGDRSVARIIAACDAIARSTESRGTVDEARDALLAMGVPKERVEEALERTTLEATRA